MPPTSSPNTIVGILSAFDENVDDELTFSIVGGANATLFNIFENALLRLSNAGQTGSHLEVIVRVADTTGLSSNATFLVSESCVSRPSFHVTLAGVLACLSDFFFFTLHSCRQRSSILTCTVFGDVLASNDRQCDEHWASLCCRCQHVRFDAFLHRRRCESHCVWNLWQ